MMRDVLAADLGSPKVERDAEQSFQQSFRYVHNRAV